MQRIAFSNFEKVILRLDDTDHVIMGGRFDMEIYSGSGRDHFNLRAGKGYIDGGGGYDTLDITAFTRGFAIDGNPGTYRPITIRSFVNAALTGLPRQCRTV